MNYHLEHHMYPMVPYHALRQLHEELRRDCPPPYANLWQAYQEIIPTIWRQRSDPSYFVQRPTRGEQARSPQSKSQSLEINA
jgi:fatty acid desaturase